MPELPEVETVRRMLESSVAGRVIRAVRLSGLPLRERIARTLPARLRGRRIERIGRRGKFLLIGLDRSLTLISHLGMSGRWLFHPSPPGVPPKHVHAVLEFTDRSVLWFEDPRRFGLLRLVSAKRLPRDPALRGLGPDPMSDPPTPESMQEIAQGSRVNLKSFLLDQRRIAGIGNIYASEILHRARLDPRRLAGRVSLDEWRAVTLEIQSVLGEAIERMGTTFSMYRTLWGESGAFGDRLRVYDRAGEPCPACGSPVRRIVQNQRSTFFCPSCQKRVPSGRRRRETRRN